MISSLPTTKDNPVIDINPFCADAIQKSILSFSISIGTIAYVEVVSTIKIASCACAIAPMLHDKVYEVMNMRSKQSDYEYIQYIHCSHNSAVDKDKSH